MNSTESATPGPRRASAAVRLTTEQLGNLVAGAADGSMPPNFTLVEHADGFSVKAPWGEHFWFWTKEAALDWAWANA